MIFKRKPHLQIPISFIQKGQCHDLGYFSTLMIGIQVGIFLVTLKGSNVYRIKSGNPDPEGVAYENFKYIRPLQAMSLS